jgi:arylsulfatase A-like enzyme
VVDWIEQQDREGTPTFTTVFTVTNHHPWGAPPGFSSPDFPVADPIYKAYLESFYYSDHCLGTFVELLRRRGLAEKTILFILADTSNPMGEHYNNHVLVHHCYEENVRIPLLILAPGRMKEGVVIDHVASQIDLLPTVMDLFGMSGPNHAIGTSLVRKAPDRIAYFANPVVRGHLGLRHRNFKFLFRVDTKTSTLYDLDRDPREEHNLASQVPELTALYQYQVRALAQLMNEVIEQQRVVPAGATP